MLIAPVLNMGIARLRHNIIKLDIALVALLSRSVKSVQRRLIGQIALTRHEFSIPRTVTHFKQPILSSFRCFFDDPAKVTPRVIAFPYDRRTKDWETTKELHVRHCRKRCLWLC